VLEGSTRLLTPQDRHLLTLVAQGLTNQAIADRLGSTVAEVGQKIEELFRRLGARNRLQLATWWLAQQPD
jgi:DNA-binding NarL/FixJ family response regulator